MPDESTVRTILAMRSFILRFVSAVFLTVYRARFFCGTWHAPPEMVKTDRAPEIFEINIAVKPADIDGQNHVNNTVYLRWVQEVATAHWEAAAPAHTRETIGWVVLRHEIDYKTPACLGDELVLRTWVGKASRITFERFTEVDRASDHELLSQVRTIWVPISTQTGKPIRVPAEIRALFST